MAAAEAETKAAPTRQKMKAEPAGQKTKAAQTGQKMKAAPAGQKTKAASTRQKTKAAPAGQKMKATPAGQKTKAAPAGQKMKATPAGQKTKAGPAGQKVKAAPSGQKVQAAPPGQKAKAKMTEEKAKSAAARSRAGAVEGRLVQLEAGCARDGGDVQHDRIAQCGAYNTATTRGCAVEMVHKISTTELPDLMTWVRRHMPHTFVIYRKLGNYMKRTTPFLNFYVDQWPDPQAVIIISDNAGQEDQMQGVYGTSEEAVLSLLDDKTVVDWTKDNFYFWALPDKLFRVAKTVVENNKKSAELFVGSQLTATPQDLKLIPVPEGMKISAISEDYFSIVIETWPYANAAYVQIMKDQLKSYPSVMLTTDSGEHVGHMIGKDIGVLGNLHVHPKFRGNGYAKVIVSQLTQIHFEHVETVRVNVLDENEVSLNLHQSVGYKIVPDMKVGFLRFKSIRHSE